jgi:hypothetical protein
VIRSSLVTTRGSSWNAGRFRPQRERPVCGRP